ncbi:MAG: hypothetical protein O7F74_11405, partial [Bacteroidetes bacterium]|nr:hypothetical protein [Bacteroidota bacterium]
MLKSSSLFCFIIVLAFCENRKETVGVLNFKDHFKYFNLKEFHLDFEKDVAELNEVEDSEFLSNLWKNILGTTPTGKTYFYSFQEDLPNYFEFSILCQYEKVGKGLTQELYYVILNSA